MSLDENKTRKLDDLADSIKYYIDTRDNTKADSSHTHGNITNDGKIGSASGKIVTTGNNGVLTVSDSITKSFISDFPSTMTPSVHSHNTGEVTDTSAYTNIGSNANATQKTINDKINTALGSKANSNNVYSKSETYTQSEITTLISNAVSDLQLFEVVNSLPSTNIKTNRLYLIVNDETITNNKYDIYLRVNNSWEQLDSLEFDISNYYNKSEIDTLLNGKVNTSDSRLTNARTPTSHSHGDITNTGTLGSIANKPLITSTNGKIATGSFGSSANTFCEGNDSRLSDARTPTSHSHTKSEISDFPSTMTPSSHTHGNVQNDGTVKVSNTVQKSKNLVTDANGYVNVEDKITKTSQLTNDGDGSNAFIKEGDSRLTNARTPSSHTHGNITNDGKVGTTASLPLITTTGGAVTTGSFGSSAGTFCQGNDSRLSNARTPTSHAHGNITNAGAIGSTANLPVITTTSGKLTTGSFGTTANTFCQGNDSRLSDARTPTAHTHDDRYYTESEIDTKLSGKVNTVSGKGLSTNDFNATYKSYVDNLVSSSATTKNAHTHTKSQITDFPTLSTVATSGSYNDLSNKPTIPTNTNQLTNNSGFLTSVGLYDIEWRDNSIGIPIYEDDGTNLYFINSFLLYDFDNEMIYYKDWAAYDPNNELAVKGDIPTNTNQLTNGAGFITSSAISGKENTSNKVTSWSTTTTNDHYPSETLVKTSLDAKLNTTDLETELESILDTLITEAQS